MAFHEPLREAYEIREQLAPAERRLAFFMGAGTSMAVGLPGITKLTERVEGHLADPFKTQFSKVKAELGIKNINVENILDHIRICRELFGNNEDRQYGCLIGAKAAGELDKQICQSIRRIVDDASPQKPIPHAIFAQWLQQLRTHRDWPVELFTTNYDLLLERSMENCSVPFFDGFIGSVTPFFVPESVEAEPSKHSQSVYPPKTWTRLWKLHGSINWYISDSQNGNPARISRSSGSDIPVGSELVIFPSREKYAQSRKLPFLTFQDRLRRFVSYSSCLMVVIGYSFGDQHLNEIIFQGLRSNPDLAVTVFCHSALQENLIRLGQELRNFAVYGTDRACIGGLVGSWGGPSRAKKEKEIWPFWDDSRKQFTLGDFNNFASFLELFIGFRPVLEAAVSPTTISKESAEPIQGDSKK